MTVGAALKQGFRMARRGRAAVWVLLLVNLGLAALAGLPIYGGILQFTGHSLMSQKLAVGFPVDWLRDFAANNPGALDRYAGIIALVGLISIPVNSLLAGGVLGRLRELERPFTVGNFSRDTARYAGRLIRLMLLGLICYWLVFRLVHQGLGGYLDKWTVEWQDDRWIFLVQLGAGALLLAGLAFVNLVIDYARLRLVMEDGASAVGALLASLGFCLGRFRRAATVYALPSLAGLALLGLYWLLVPWPLINRAGPAGPSYRELAPVALLFVGQQLVMFGRYWFRVAAWASEWSYYSGTRPALLPDEQAS